MILENWMNTIQEKIDKLHLILLDGDECQKLDEYYKKINALPAVMDYSKWFFVTWRNGDPYLYTLQYIEEHELSYLETALESLVMMGNNQKINNKRCQNCNSNYVIDGICGVCFWDVQNNNGYVEETRGKDLVKCYLCGVI